MTKVQIYGSITALGVALGGMALLVLVMHSTSTQEATLTGATSWIATPETEGANQEKSTAASLFLSQGPGIRIETYQNTAHGFSLSYPNELQVSEFDEGQGAQSVVFQKPGTEAGFQIFIVPYSKDQISEERLQQDLQGGAMRDPVEISLGDSIRAIAFWSTSPIIGESREVWFIKDGYLYEFTTYAALDAWFASVMGTLRFN